MKTLPTLFLMASLLFAPGSGCIGSGREAAKQEAASAWITKTANAHGYFVTDALGSPDRRYLYTSNSRSDSITMINLASGDVRVINSHDYVREMYLPAVFRSAQ